MKPHINWLMSRCTDGGDVTVALPIFNHPWCKFNAQRTGCVLQMQSAEFSTDGDKGRPGMSPRSPFS